MLEKRNVKIKSNLNNAFFVNDRIQSNIAIVFQEAQDDFPNIQNIFQPQKTNHQLMKRTTMCL